MLTNSKHHWGWVSIGLHWLTAVLIIGLSTVGLLMSELPASPLKIQVYALHKSFGITVLALTVLRLVWRLSAGRPNPLPATRLQNLAAKTTHAALYVLLLAMPLSGWLYNSASGFPLHWFNLLSLPKLSSFNPDLKQLARSTHENLFYILATLLVLHAGAALWHHYIRRDRTLTRMLGK